MSRPRCPCDDGRRRTIGRRALAVLVALLLAGCGGERGADGRRGDAPAPTETGGGKAGSEGGDSTEKDGGGGFGY